MKKIFLLLSLLFPISTFAFKDEFLIHHRISLLGAEGWDCLSVDSANNHLFITRGNHVDVIDLKTEKLIGKISEHIDGAHDIAFVPNLNKGYVTSGKTGKIIVFDLKTLDVLKEISAGKKPDLIHFDEFTSRIFSINAEDESITVIDTKTDAVLKTIKTDGNLEFAVSDLKGQIFINNEAKNSIVVIDAKEMAIKKSWPLKGCKEPTGLSADFKTHRLFSACANETMIISDSENGQLIKKIPIGKGPDGSAFDDGYIFSSNGSGTLTIVKENESKMIEVFQNLATQKGARTMAINPMTHDIYLVAAKYESSNKKATPENRPKIINGTVEVLVIKK